MDFGDIFDDSDEGDNFDDSDNDNSNALECDMVYVLFAKYALPEAVSVCPVVDVEGEDDSQLVPKKEDSTLTLKIDSALKKLFMMFSKPNLAMSMHL